MAFRPLVKLYFIIKNYKITFDSFNELHSILN